MTVTVEDEVGNYINNRKRRELTSLEDDHNMQVLIHGREDVSPEFFKIECEDSSGREVRV